jgi:hypothetical protein
VRVLLGAVLSEVPDCEPEEAKHLLNLGQLGLTGFEVRVGPGTM